MDLKNWYDYSISNIQRNKIEELCKKLVVRLSKPREILNNNDISLSAGSSGVLILLNEINKILNIDTENLIHKYICCYEESIYKNKMNFSLYRGITGFNYAISIINNTTGNYKNLIKSLDENIITNIPLVLDNIIKKNSEIYEPLCDYEFDCINGLAGISRYLLYRKNSDDRINGILNKLSEYFIGLCVDKKINNRIYKGWLSKRFEVDNNEKLYYAKINEYNLGLAHGLPSILSILSLFSINSINSEHTNIAIKNILNWLVKLDEENAYELWPSYIGASEEIFGFKRVAWCYGNPGISNSLHLASKAIMDSNILKFSEKLLLNIFKVPYDKWLISSPMLCHGYSGILQIISRSENNEIICAKSNELIDIILNNVDYNNKFCFNNNDMGHIYDSPDFLIGASGIVLSLLSTISIDEPVWDQVLLLS